MLDLLKTHFLNSFILLRYNVIIDVRRNFMWMAYRCVFKRGINSASIFIVFHFLAFTFVLHFFQLYLCVLQSDSIGMRIIVLAALMRVRYGLVVVLAAGSSRRLRYVVIIVRVGAIIHKTIYTSSLNSKS